ncbi:hypothetical protein SAMN04515647_3092 [Cohaesibacter sp. ES.047]|nr:hypothetical protein SAMN04515647_3092 [Cohaesibacter sp. ES.047]
MSAILSHSFGTHEVRNEDLEGPLGPSFFVSEELICNLVAFFGYSRHTILCRWPKSAIIAGQTEKHRR